MENNKSEISDYRQAEISKWRLILGNKAEKFGVIFSGNEMVTISYTKIKDDEGEHLIIDIPNSVLQELVRRNIGLMIRIPRTASEKLGLGNQDRKIEIKKERIKEFGKRNENLKIKIPIFDEKKDTNTNSNKKNAKDSQKKNTEKSEKGNSKNIKCKIAPSNNEKETESEILLENQNGNEESDNNQDKEYATITLSGDEGNIDGNGECSMEIPGCEAGNSNYIQGKTKGKSNHSNKAKNQNNFPSEFQRLDATLKFVYDPPKERSASLGGSQLSIPAWIENVNELFPKKTKEVLEKDLVKKSDLKDIFQHPELFEKVEPNLDMVKTIIALKHMMPERIKNVARMLVKKVVEDLKDKLKNEVERHIIGALKKDMHTPLKVFRNIDWDQSIQRNLKYYNKDTKKILMINPRFFSNEKRKKPWQIIVLVDESGSMSDSVIYSVVMASIFTSIPAIKTNLAIFDTQVVDMSDRLDDPVDVLMSVQLGGGTDITNALRYGRGLIKNPKKCIMIIISDFYEGRPYADLTRELRSLLEGGTRVLALAALGSSGSPFYNRNYANEMKMIGIDTIACTPESLSELIAKYIQ